MGDETHASDRGAEPDARELDDIDEFGGDPVCWAHLLCPDCGVVLTPGVEHRSGCRAPGGVGEPGGPVPGADAG
jgi:hypothetical protein